MKSRHLLAAGPLRVEAVANSDDSLSFTMSRRIAMMRSTLVAGALMLAATAASAQSPTPAILPNPTLTPGVVASTDEAEVCGHSAAGTYSQTHRLTTAAMKAEVFREYGIDPAVARNQSWEIDHRLPLALGGGDQLGDLWPQPGEGHGTLWTFHVKDRLEVFAWHEVCRFHRVSLTDAQSWFLAPDWRVAYCAKIGGTPCGVDAVEPPEPISPLKTP